MAMSPERYRALKSINDDRRRTAEKLVPATAGADAVLDAEFVSSVDEMFERIEFCERRLEEGTYGICFGCLEEIPEDDLRKRPNFVLCQKCEAAAEATGHRKQVAQLVRKRFAGRSPHPTLKRVV